MFGFPGGSVAKNPQETQIQSLCWEDPLGKEMATHSSILAWRNSMDRGVWWAPVHVVTESDATSQLNNNKCMFTIIINSCRTGFVTEGK